MNFQYTEALVFHFLTLLDMSAYVGYVRTGGCHVTCAFELNALSVEDSAGVCDPHIHTQ